MMPLSSEGVQVSCSAARPATGRKADVLMAAWTAAEAAQRMLKDGASNNEITATIAQVAGHGRPNAAWLNAWLNAGRA